MPSPCDPIRSTRGRSGLRPPPGRRTLSVPRRARRLSIGDAMWPLSSPSLRAAALATTFSCAVACGQGDAIVPTVTAKGDVSAIEVVADTTAVSTDADAATPDLADTASPETVDAATTDQGMTDVSGPAEVVADTTKACSTAADCGLQACKSGTCAACVVSADCGGGATCLGGKCLPDLTCASDKQCQDKGLVCDKTTGKCAECAVAADCLAGGKCQFGVCIAPGAACATTKQCPLGQICHKAQQKCVQCTDSADCATGQACVATICVPKVCTPAASKCVAVNAIATCDSTGTYWSTASCDSGHSCVGDDCKKWLCKPDQLVCQGAFVVKCASDGFATTPVQDCAKDGKKCEGGKCSAVLACTPGTALCDGADAVKLCKADGSGWTSIGCSKGTACQSGACKLQCKPGDVLGGDTLAGGVDLGAVAALADDSWLLAGQAKPAGVGTTKGVFVRADPSGKAIWTQAFDGPDYAGSALRAVASQGPTLAAAGSLGQASKYASAMWLVRANAAGTLFEHGKYSDTSDDPAVGWDAEGLAPDGVGGWYLAGSRFTAGPQSADGVVVRVDAEGKKQWHKTMGGLFGDELWAIAAVPSGGAIAVGSTWASNEATGWLVRLDGGGKVSFELKPAWASSCVLTAVAVQGESIATAGHCSGQGWYAAYDINGKLWFKGKLTASDLPNADVAAGVVWLPEKGLLVGGGTMPAGKQGKGLALRVDAAGILTDGWQVKVGDGSALVVDLARRSDGAVALVAGPTVGIYCGW